MQRRASDWAQEAETRGAGEILVTSIPNNGQMMGLDLDLISSVASKVSIPVIASGGLGSSLHAVEGIKAGADAIGASSVFQFTQVTPENIKNGLSQAGYLVRNNAPGSLIL
jgi:cyclase